MNLNGDVELSNTTHLLQKPSLKSYRLYEKWPGKNHFLLKGLLMTGPTQDLPRFLLMNLGIFLSGFQNFLYLTIFDWECLSPVLHIISLIFFCLTYILIFLCSFTDPGIIPRKTVFDKSKIPIPALYNKTTIFETLKNKFHNVYNDDERSYIYVTSEQTHDIYIFKFCHTCQIFRPPKASHCRYCDNCIEVFDHHCPYLWNCIGKRNYKYYFGFLVSFNLFELFNLIGSGIYFYFYFLNEGCYENIRVFNPTQIYLMFATVLAVVLFLILGYFLIFHLSLLWNGSTTKDYYTNLKYSPSKGFQQSRNWCSNDPVLFSPNQIISEID